MKFLLLIAAAFALWWLWKNSVRRVQGMSPAEAAKLLGVSPDADVETILAAHKRLIAKVHPDAGGTAELAAGINRARDTLLQKISP